MIIIFWTRYLTSYDKRDVAKYGGYNNLPSSSSYLTCSAALYLSTQINRKRFYLSKYKTETWKPACLWTTGTGVMTGRDWNTLTPYHHCYTYTDSSLLRLIWFVFQVKVLLWNRFHVNADFKKTFFLNLFVSIWPWIHNKMASLKCTIHKDHVRVIDDMSKSKSPRSCII